MKTNKILNIALVFVLAVMGNACSKQVKQRTEDIPLLKPSNTDIDAGSWKTIFLTSATEYPVAVPAVLSSPAYVAELNEIKGYQLNITEAQQKSIHYWGAGGVLRWNELMRELVAKYNLPPYQNADGSYPFPSAANPFAYPLFPFANPPYAARAYAYISAAQYDGLVAAWYYKKLYGRPAPYKTDLKIQSLLPQSDLSSYPSEDAVLAGVTAEMMKLLFPGEIAFIQQKAEEHKLARIISGSNTRSDIEAGEALGRLVAQKFTVRARADKAGAAAGTPADWAKLESDAIAKGETPWISLDSPKRPPMLPLFGKVKPFLFDEATTVSLRPGPPPSTSSEQMKKELAEIANIMNNTSREQTAIVHFWADGVATYTPPGHWNAIAADDFIGKNFSEIRWARNLALLNMTLMDAAIVCWDTKYAYFNPRPSQMQSTIKTTTGLPNFPSYISGHSTFSSAAATLLSYLIPEKASAYDAMAKEASISRMYGGIHYRSDCEIGLVTGKKVGDYAVNRAKSDGAD